MFQLTLLQIHTQTHSPVYHFGVIIFVHFEYDLRSTRYLKA